MSDFGSLLSLSPEGYSIQGLPVLPLCQKFGTPFFLYDLDLALQRYTEIKSWFPWTKKRALFAMKANYNPDILRTLREGGAGIDSVSPAEAMLALRLGYKPEDILYTVNSITDSEIRSIHDQGILLNIDSLSGLVRVGKAFPGSEVCIRFNPDVVAGEDIKLQTGGDLTKFGILMEDIQEVLRIVAQYKLKVVGLHEHTGSGISETEKVFASIKNLIGMAKREWFPDLRFLDFGGGFKAPYTPDEKRIDYTTFGKKVSDIFAAFCKEYGRELALWFEPGKYVTAECGMLVVQVNTLKQNKTRLIAGTDSGFPHLIRPVLYNAYHHIVNLSNPTGARKTYDICGNICESGDCFATDRELSEIREGDYVGILNAGSYCYSMASIYNLRALPAEIVVRNKEVKVSRCKKTPEALVEDILGGCAS
jgi:diaminopimelate decarboxylase